MANGFGFTPLQMAMVGPHVFGRILSRCAIRSPPSFRLSHVLPRLLTVARDKRRWAVRHTSSATRGQSPRCSHECWLNRRPADEHDSASGDRYAALDVMKGDCGVHNSVVY